MESADGMQFSKAGSDRKRKVGKHYIDVVLMDDLNRNVLSMEALHSVSNDRYKDPFIMGLEDGYIQMYNLSLRGDDSSSDQSSNITVKHLEAGSHVRCVEKWRPHTDWVTHMLAAPQLQGFISASLDNSIQVLDMTKGKSYLRMENEQNDISDSSRRGVHNFDYSPERNLLCSCGISREATVWNPKARQKMCTLTDHRASLISVKFIDRVSQLITMSEDKIVKVWDVRTFRCIQTLTDKERRFPEDKFTGMYTNTVTRMYSFSKRGGKQNQKTAMTYDPTHDAIVTCAGTPVVWREVNTQAKLETGSAWHNNYEGHLSPIVACMYNKRMRQLVTTDDQIINVWDIRSGECLRKWSPFSDNTGRKITAVCFDYDQRRLLTGCDDGTVEMWSLDGKRLKIFDREHKKPYEISSLQYIVTHEETSQSQSYVASAGFSTNIYLWPDHLIAPSLHRIAVGKGAIKLSTHGSHVYSMTFSPPNKLALGTASGSIVLYNLNNLSLMSINKSDIGSSFRTLKPRVERDQEEVSIEDLPLESKDGNPKVKLLDSSECERPNSQKKITKTSNERSRISTCCINVPSAVEDIFSLPNSLSSSPYSRSTKRRSREPIVCSEILKKSIVCPNNNLNSTTAINRNSYRNSKVNIDSCNKSNNDAHPSTGPVKSVTSDKSLKKVSKLDETAPNINEGNHSVLASPAEDMLVSQGLDELISSVAEKLTSDFHESGGIDSERSHVAETKPSEKCSSTPNSKSCDNLCDVSEQPAEVSDSNKEQQPQQDIKTTLKDSLFSSCEMEQTELPSINEKYERTITSSKSVKSDVVNGEEGVPQTSPESLQSEITTKTCEVSQSRNESSGYLKSAVRRSVFSDELESHPQTPSSVAAPGEVKSKWGDFPNMQTPQPSAPYSPAKKQILTAVQRENEISGATRFTRFRAGVQMKLLAVTEALAYLSPEIIITLHGDGDALVWRLKDGYFLEIVACFPASYSPGEVAYVIDVDRSEGLVYVGDGSAMISIFDVRKCLVELSTKVPSSTTESGSRTAHRGPSGRIYHNRCQIRLTRCIDLGISGVLTQMQVLQHSPVIIISCNDCTISLLNKQTGMTLARFGSVREYADSWPVGLPQTALMGPHPVEIPIHKKQRNEKHRFGLVFPNDYDVTEVVQSLSELAEVVAGPQASTDFAVLQENNSSGDFNSSGGIFGSKKNSTLKSSADNTEASNKSNRPTNDKGKSPPKGMLPAISSSRSLRSDLLISEDDVKTNTLMYQRYCWNHGAERMLQRKSSIIPITKGSNEIEAQLKNVQQRRRNVRVSGMQFACTTVRRLKQVEKPTFCVPRVNQQCTCAHCRLNRVREPESDTLPSFT